MKVEVEEALDELDAGAPGNGVQFVEDADGGAFVLVDGVAIGGRFFPSLSWIAFHITALYPDADVYPHFIDANVRYVGTGPATNQSPEGNLPTAMTRGQYLILGTETPAIQISRASHRRNSETDSALDKLLRVISWLKDR